jgi:hypothetical protein
MNWKAVLLVVGLIFFEPPTAADAKIAIHCENPTNWAWERACSNPDIRLLFESFVAAALIYIGGYYWEDTEEYGDDYTMLHIEQLCLSLRNPRPSISESDACLISFIRQETNSLETKTQRRLPSGFGKIQAHRISWVTPTPNGETSHPQFPGIKSYGFIVFPALSEPRFRELLKMPEDIMPLADVSRSVQVDFDILDLRPDNLTFRYRYHQETLSGEIRAWETVKILDLTRDNK